MNILQEEFEKTLNELEIWIIPEYHQITNQLKKTTKITIDEAKEKKLLLLNLEGLAKVLMEKQEKLKKTSENIKEKDTRYLLELIHIFLKQIQNEINEIIKGITEMIVISEEETIKTINKILQDFNGIQFENIYIEFRIKFLNRLKYLKAISGMEYNKNLEKI